LLAVTCALTLNSVASYSGIVHLTATDEPAIPAALKDVGIAVCCFRGDNEPMSSSHRISIDACVEEGVTRHVAGDWSMDFQRLQVGEHPPKDPMISTWKYLEEREEQIKVVHVLNACFWRARGRGSKMRRRRNSSIGGAGRRGGSSQRIRVRRRL
jgi:hypothetical protein